MRLDIRRIETLKEGAEAVGNRARVKVVKNKVAPPFRQAEFDIIYGEGISHEGNLIDLGVERGMVQKSGAYFSFGEERLGQGRSAARAFLREHPDVAGDPGGPHPRGRRHRVAAGLRPRDRRGPRARGGAGGREGIAHGVLDGVLAVC